jgi:EAL domain-containing protein (putative c-di-GMP-specific phosphodiesterase class I)
MNYENVNNILVTGEGVETREQVALLQDMGYSLMQGCIFAKPMPEVKLLQWLQDAALAATPVSKMRECA